MRGWKRSDTHNIVVVTIVTAIVILHIKTLNMNNFNRSTHSHGFKCAFHFLHIGMVRTRTMAWLGIRHISQRINPPNGFMQTDEPARDKNIHNILTQDFFSKKNSIMLFPLHCKWLSQLHTKQQQYQKECEKTTHWKVYFAFVWFYFILWLCIFHMWREREKKPRTQIRNMWFLYL